MPVHLAPVAETGFSHSLTPYKIVGFFLDLPSHNQVEILFLESVTFQLYDHMLSWGHRQHVALGNCLFLWTKEIHQSTASERMTQLPVR